MPKSNPLQSPVCVPEVSANAMEWGGYIPPDDAALRVSLEEAAATVRALPRAFRSARLTAWPEVVQDTVSLMSASEGGRTRPPAPSPRAIDRMDKVLVWLLACEPAERRILWARACRIPWRRLEDLDGRSHTTLRQVAGGGLDRIRRHLRANAADRL